MERMTASRRRVKHLPTIQSRKERRKRGRTSKTARAVVVDSRASRQRLLSSRMEIPTIPSPATGPVARRRVGQIRVAIKVDAKRVDVIEVDKIKAGEIRADALIRDGGLKTSGAVQMGADGAGP